MFKFKKHRKIKNPAYCRLRKVSVDTVWMLIRFGRAYRAWSHGGYVKLGFTRGYEVKTLLAAGMLFVKLESVK